MSLAPQARTFQEQWLPQRPYASDNYRDNARMERDEAFTKRLIQPNSTKQVNLLVQDIDAPDGVMSVLEDKDGILPQYVSENPDNGHVHAAYLIETPVTISPAGHRKPIVFMEAVNEGLRALTGGDRSYTGNLFKSPVHPDWKHWHTPGLGPYTLDYLAGELDNRNMLPARGWKRQARELKHVAGVSRNCDLYYTAREKAWKQVKHYKRLPNAVDAYSEYVHTLCHQLNIDPEMGFATPLAVTEVNGIARSIVKWVVHSSDMWRRDEDKPEWIELQRMRSRAGNAVKGAQKSERIALARYAYINSGMTLTNKQIAEAVGTSVRWVQMNRAAIKGESTHC